MEENNRPGPGFEQTDINVIAVGKVAIVLLLATILVMAFVVGVFNYLKVHEGGTAVTVDPTTIFPEPQLEKTPIPDLKAIREAEDNTLTTYGWVDQQKGIVRIPIAKAMDMVVAKGLPVRAATPPNSDGMSVPTESGLGPKMIPPGGPLGGPK
ncbi:MAG TPA: hypothetical protein VHW09_25635 [Bryobacteraceae bacterium]|jgi:hypothetical protein|nr:hypothetical protein [Bryobacteraceae bacterium]